MNSRWRAYRERALETLWAMRPLAEAYDVTIAVEKHRDITPDDLHWFREEVGGTHIGVSCCDGMVPALA